jgi:hypothetical protein
MPHPQKVKNAFFEKNRSATSDIRCTFNETATHATLLPTPSVNVTATHATLITFKMADAQ